MSRDSFRALGESPEVDIEAAAGAFADCFIGANPNGVNCGHNDEQFRAAILQGNAFYRSIGTKYMKITGLEITPLDDFHAMVKVQWDSRYVKVNGEAVQIEFDVIYLVLNIQGKPKIFGYVTGDEQKVLKEHGLMPGRSAPRQPAQRPPPSSRRSRVFQYQHRVGNVPSTFQAYGSPPQLLF